MRRSISGPIVVIGIGTFFFLNNFYPQTLSWNSLVRYWPFLLIGIGVIRLIEVFLDAGQARPLPSSSFSGGGIFFLMLLAFLAWGLSRSAHGHWKSLSFVRMAPADMFGEEFEFEVKQSLPVTDVDKRLVLEGLHGNVTISGGDSSTIELNGHRTIHGFSQGDASRANGQARIEVVRRGNDIVLQSAKPADARDLTISYDLELKVPRHMGLAADGAVDNITAESLDGDIDVSGDSGSVRLTSIGGNARVETTSRKDLVRAVGVKGNLDLRGTGNDVQVEDVIGQVTIQGNYFGTLDFRNLAKPLHFESDQTDLRVEKLPGSISMDLGDFHADNVTGPLHLRCQSRDVHISDFSNEVEVIVERGDVELAPQKAPLSKMSVRVQAGDIDVTIPDHAPFDLHATTSQGDASNDYGDGVTTASEGSTASMKSTTAAGPAITLTTDRGNITVKK